MQTHKSLNICGFNSTNVATFVDCHVAQAPTAWRQALFSCDSSAEPGVRYCRDLALPFLMRTLMNEPATPDLLHPALSTLAAYDADTHSDLLATIVSYVASGCSQAECSRQLHIHLNTLKYRLKRICELTGIDFKDQDELFYLRLSVALLPDDATQAAREPRLQEVCMRQLRRARDLAAVAPGAPLVIDQHSI